MNIVTKIIPFIALIFLVNSCQQEDIFEIPNSLGNEENASLSTLMSTIDAGQKSLVSIDYVKDLIVSGEATEITSDIVIKGYVVSSDATGNFYKEFYVQDDPSSPSSAIRMLVDITDSYNMYNLGREVYVDLKGLYVGEYRTGDGVITVGELDIAQNRITNVRDEVMLSLIHI